MEGDFYRRDILIDYSYIFTSGFFVLPNDCFITREIDFIVLKAFVEVLFR